MRNVLRSLALMALMLYARSAAAYTCELEAADIDVLTYPRPGDKAPANARILVLTPQSARTVTARLRWLADKTIVPTQRTTVGWGGIELVPTAALAPGRYQVEVKLEEGPRTIGPFEVVAGEDKQAPAGVAALGGSRIDASYQTDAGPRRAEWLRLTVGAATDDQTPTASLSYAVWLLDRGEGERPPDAIQPVETTRSAGGHETLRLGGGADWCGNDANLQMAMPRGRAPLRLRVRARDLAGNLGPPSDLTIDLAVRRKTFQNPSFLDALRCDSSVDRTRVVQVGAAVAPDAHVFVMREFTDLGPDRFAPKLSLSPAVPFTARTVGLADVSVTELTPGQPLEAGRRYRVLERKTEVGALRIEAGASAAAATGKATAATSHGQWLEVRVDEPGLYAVWTPVRGGAIEADAPPTTFVMAKDGALVLGQRKDCALRNFSFPEELSRLSLRVRAVAADGAYGPQSDLTVDLAGR